MLVPRETIVALASICAEEVCIRLKWCATFSGEMRNVTELIETLAAVQRANAWTDGQFAEKVGISRQLWGQYRTGSKPPGRTFLVCAGRAFPGVKAIADTLLYAVQTKKVSTSPEAS
jgi:hypothetical protein